MRRGGIVVAAVLLVGLAGTNAASAGTQGPTKSLGKANGIEYRWATFPNVISLDGAAVGCKPDTYAIGGGGLIDGADGLSMLVGTSPFDLSGDVASGWQALGTSMNGREQRTWTMCHKNDLSFAPGFTSFPGTGLATYEAVCPSGRLVSGGVFNDDDTPVRLLESRPIDSSDDLDSAPDDGWRLTGENMSGSVSTPMILVACSTTAELSYVSKTTNVASGALGKTVAKCPNRYAVTGGGFEGGAGGPVSGLSPWDSKDDGKVPEDGWESRVYNAAIDTYEVTSTAICVKKL